ncbi:MAG: pentapeptide repeat-containing protein [Gammaproteobacteria bacterium]|nr:pentapeptide repeat-containing protein [Gammaproteobacteria bacterium]
MAQSAPEIKNDELYRLLREGKVEEFNQRKAAGETCDLTGADFRGVHLNGLDADGLDLSNSYFRMANLRGIDFSKANLEGASIHGAQISGAYFPAELEAAEINLSLEHGTRLRYRQCK